MGNDTFLQVEQIIPLPETKEFMIDAQEKEREENTKSITVKDSEERLIKFWTLLKEKLRETNFTFLNKTSAKPYYNLGFHRGPGLYSFCIGKQTFRVELYFTNDTEKEHFDAMEKYKEQISKAFNGVMIWERLNNKKASRIKFEMPLDRANALPGRFADELYWDELITWYADAMFKFYNAINPYLEKVLKKEFS